MKLRGMTYGLAAALLFLVACGGAETPPAEEPAPSGDLLAGTWVINVSKSTYSPAELAPMSGMTVFAPGPDGTTVTTDGVNAKGQKTHAEYVTKFDGADVPTNGTVDGKPNPDADTSAWTKIDDHNYEITSKLKGQVMTTTKIVIAADGKSRTLTTTGKNAAGQAINNVVLSEKQ
jgi:hypothetical protein